MNIIKELDRLIKSGNDNVAPADTAENLGTIFHKHIDMTTHVNQIVRTPTSISIRSQRLHTIVTMQQQLK